MRTTDAFAIQITNDDPEYTLTGDPVPGEPLLYFTNLTILTLTADFDQAVVFCGETTDRDLGNFTIRIIQPPSPPLNVRLDAHGIGTTFIGIHWCPPVFEGGPPFSSYNIYVERATGTTYSTTHFNELTENFIVMGLLPGVTYRLSVTAVSEAFGTVAESDHSNVLEATTDFTEPPSPPLNVRLDTDGIGTTSIRIQWFPPTFEGVPPFSSYNFYVDPPTGFDYSTPRLNELNETTRAFTVTELLPGVTYRLTVTAVSEAFGAVAESNRSNAFEATTNFTGIPTTPVILLATSEAPSEVLLIVQVRAAGVGPSPHSLAFDVLAVQGTSVIDLAGVPQTNYVDGTPTLISIKDNRLEPNQTYSFHVRARNMFGASEYVSSTLVTVKEDSEDSAGTSGGSISSCTGVVVGISVCLLVAVAIIVTLSIIIIVLWRKKVGAPMEQHNGRQVNHVNPQVQMSALPASQDPEPRDYEAVGIYDEVDKTGAVNPTAIGVSAAVAPNNAYGLVPPPAQSRAAHT